MPPIENKEYYILSVFETPENEEYLCFASKKEVNKVLPVSSNVNEAVVSNEHLLEDEELIYLEKDKVDGLTFGTEDGCRYLLNSRNNRIKLNLKYKEGTLQRATGAGIKEDYVLVLDDTRKDSFTLCFLSNAGANSITTNLELASVHEASHNLNMIYVSREKVESLATLFPDESRVLLNVAANLKQLGLEYNKDGFLCIAEKKATEEEQEEEPKEEKKISWLGLGMKAVSLCIDIRQALEESKPKPVEPNNNSINAIAEEIHDINREKGFWDKKRNIGEMLMLVTSELGESMEALRKGKESNWIAYHQAIRDKKSPKVAFEQHIKDSFEDEIADAVIRLFDLSEGLNINLERQIRFKMDYNRCRERFHGKEF